MSIVCKHVTRICTTAGSRGVASTAHRGTQLHKPKHCTNLGSAVGCVRPSAQWHQSPTCTWLLSNHANNWTAQGSDHARFPLDACNLMLQLCKWPLHLCLYYMLQLNHHCMEPWAKLSILCGHNLHTRVFHTNNMSLLLVSSKSIYKVS